MATTKKPYGFRLSDQAVKNLDEIHAITGMTNTAIVEFALAQMRAFTYNRRRSGCASELSRETGT